MTDDDVKARAAALVTTVSAISTILANTKTIVGQQTTAAASQAALAAQQTALAAQQATQETTLATLQTDIDARLSRIETALADLGVAIATIELLVNPPDQNSTGIRGFAVVLSQTRKDGTRIMANTALLNDAIVTAQIGAIDDAGNTVPLPAGANFSVVSNNPTQLQAIMNAADPTNTQVIYNALVKGPATVSWTATEMSTPALLPPFTETYDISEDMAPVAGTVVSTTSVPQPVPAT